MGWDGVVHMYGVLSCAHGITSFAGNAIHTQSYLWLYGSLVVFFNLPTTVISYSEALPFFLLLIDLSKATTLAKTAFKSRNKVCVVECPSLPVLLCIIFTTSLCVSGGGEGEHWEGNSQFGAHHDLGYCGGGASHQYRHHFR